ncbi:reprolysin-like metallopeptidase [Kaistella antarctica]|uniref:Por secretion system C-terminal sorting domain n=1 Tax=Kaistella antarctica TaxID=266748 RepID=A0A448NP54_9FLAO|nr:M12 family metallo-peptidase [Kaistella antarctica]KEY19558.1 hypothetical protein HY04_14295 [Kaistella antarctica]SEW08356.1 Por secretion system C-terminal sorting domain-containing protein [Kaistella antarctica]VEH97133.1 Por secretion system C-terminal sorting domain [Kaistella antarctica]
MKKLLLLFILSFGMLYSQQITENEIPGKVYPLTILSLQKAVNNQKSSPKLIKNLNITLPNMNGQKVVYKLIENDLTEQRAAAVTTFNGVSADGKSTLKLSLFEDHIIAILKNSEGYFYVEPYNTSTGNYRVYPAFADFGVNFTCDNAFDSNLMQELNSVRDNLISKGSAPNFPYGNQLRKFRMAIATTGEFTQAFSGDQNIALAEALSMLNLINLIYESEVSMTFNVISKTTDKTLIFTDPNTDPFTVSPSFASAANSQTGFTTMNTNGTLPYALYDIGHTFHIMTGGGAQGQAGSQPCTATAKARAWSQWNITMPKAITANLIVHEMGHQFTAGHTYNAVGGSAGSPTFCTSGWSSTAAVEPGAGTTIMSYGNNCTVPTNQTNTGNNGLSYFNARSLDQITSNLTGPANCFTTQGTGNQLPVANAGSDITIPKNTPFKLNGIGSDPNDTNLSYTWEQADIATANDKGAFGSTIAGAGGYVASNSTANAPLFRSEQSNSSTERYFPKLTYVLNNQNLPPVNDAEVLPAVARTMKFRFTVRDNNALSGGVDSDEMVVTVDNSGPLQVTYPSVTGITIPALSAATITWSVNGTNALKSTVNILLSIDGGNTYPYNLVINTPNDGSQSITMPNVPQTSTARVKIVAAINANAEFYDVSDKDFTISSSCLAYSSFINPTSSVVATVGTAASNLNMVAPGAASNSYTIKNIDYTTATSNNIFAYSDITMTAPQLAVNNYPSVTYSFKVTKTGSYVFTKTGAFLIVTIHSGSPYTLGNFVASNAYNVSGSSYSSSTSTQNMVLQEGVTYYAVICNFSNPANNLTYDIISTGPGSLYNSLTTPAGFNYTFLAISNLDSKIKAVSSTANFTSLPVGTYTVKGISYPTAVNSALFVNQTVAEIATAGTCFAISGNERSLQLTSGLATSENSDQLQGFMIAPNPVDNYLTVVSKQKITSYQILDISGRLIESNVLKNKTINFSRLKTATYLLLLLDEGKVVHQEKIIKK